MTVKSYCTVAELKAQINLSGSGNDSALEDIIEAVSQKIDRFCNRTDGFFDADDTASARTYSGSGDTVQLIDPCIAITLVEVKDAPSDDTYVSWASTDWIAATGDPRNPDFNALPYRFLIVAATGDFNTFTSGTYTGLRGFRQEAMKSRGVPTVRVTAKWGFSDGVPPIIKEACIAQTAKWYKKGQSTWADQTATTAFGEMKFTSLDKDIQSMLVNSRFVKPAIGRR